MQKLKGRILAQLTRLKTYRDNKPGAFWSISAITGASLFGMMAAFGTAPSGMPLQTPQQTIVERLATPLAEILPSPEGKTALYVREERIQRGDTVPALLARLGVDNTSALAFLRDHRDTQIVARQLAPGKSLTAQITANGDLRSLIFPLNGGSDRALVVERNAQGYQASEQALQLEKNLVMKSTEIRYSLFGATDAAGIPDSVATQLADIFGGDIDFHRDIRKGDKLSVIYEAVTHMGKLVRTERILAAEFINNGRSFRAFWYDNPSADSKGGYYNAEGKSLRKAFLRSPLEFSRVTSGFSNARFHPILQKWRAHKGVDYGAPTGTRVKATSDGVVEFVGRQGGYGNVIVLRHQGRYSTLYGHLSGFAAGLRKGSRVAQAQVIGYVGATGLASGPHLHYEFRIDGVHQNPLAVVLPGSPPLGAGQMQGFRQNAEPLLAKITLIRDTNLALSE